MPNHVTTVLKAPKHVIDSLKSEGREVDFNSVITQPSNDDPMFTATYTNFAPGFGGYSMDGYSPMDWARNAWGTKWNAYDVERVSDTEVRFDTAWSHPLPVIAALTEKFPEDTLEIQYADEDLGRNLGEYTVKNGEVLSDREFDEYSDEAEDFAAWIKYGKSYEDLRKEWDED